MLHRSFKPAKCKTALKLAIPRIKLMKNKREAHVQHLKRELAQLLESGQDQTARIRVEHVVREENTVAAFNLLEIYCELILARMPIIESQKNCPTDLKEAISSVIFASARCEEIPELKDVSKHFTAKYGKEFTSSALELRPNCGVGRMLVEKLSANAPDGPTKLKILTAIAEEHKIKWNPESFGAKESKIYDDMLNGPNTSMEATKILADPPIIQASPSHEQSSPSVQLPNNDKEQPHVQDSKHIGKSDAPTSLYEHKSRSSLHPNNFDYSNTSTNTSMSSGTYPPNSKHGIENQVMEFKNSYSGNERPSSLSRQHWQMEFKDATAAAQAAAESAERASMAARAAAELSSRGNISQQHPMESHMSSPHSKKDEEQQKYTHSSSENEHGARHPVNNSHHGRNSGDYKHSNVARSSDNSTHSSFKSTAASFNGKASVNNGTADAYSQKNKSEGRQMEHFAEPSIHRNSGKNGMQFVNELHDIKNPLNLDQHEVRVGDQSSYSSSQSQSNTFTVDHFLVSNLDWQKSDSNQRNLDESRMQFENELHDTKTHDDHVVVSNLNRQKPRNDSDEDLFLPNDKGSLPRSTKETTDSFNNASAVFDDYGSDDYEDNFGLEEEHEVREYNMNFSSPGQRSPSYPFTTGNSWSVQQNNSSPEKSISKSHIFSEERTTPALFESTSSFSAPSNVDDLAATFDDYGLNSESEEEVDKSKFVRSSDFSIGSGKQNTDSNKPENSSSLTPQLAEGIEDTEHSNEFSLEESKELKLGNLTGGLRNKGYRCPPFSKIPRDNLFSYGEAVSDTSTGMKQSSSPAAVEALVNSGSYDQEPYSRKGNDEVSRKLGPKALVNQVDSSDDGSGEQPKDTFSSIEGHYNRTTIFEESEKSISRSTVPYFDSDEDLPKASLKAHSNTSLSRRTKASLPYSQRSSNYRTTVSSEPALVFGHGEKKNLTSRNTGADEALPKRQPHKKNSDNRESSLHSWLASQPTSRPVSENKGFSVGGTLKSSEKEQQSALVCKSTTSGSAKSLNAKSSIGEGSSKESATHVHPKLPDFDALTSHLNSLRQNS
ncbi:S-adenosyl-L-methionine-dependent methyltransferases superfamily protein, putative isoform 1 [Hibiscus syriacus]|uniref:S-adenosyl-L-methionine-dependent methyltransferases superfamily protein, putative isoform 1 n=1 Tax=Hibiscus syriacus TaxID=106335 RepID=A0A6A2XK77_HIBSY|nr:uncharacterized protein LOC120166439 [Hibiscus syriacus]KAE8675938.1 S-adenosyl-L-methionine-dependent methyltransferases superfamily protein, putative isoform 1 [Hibiscus syriacus]